MTKSNYERNDAELIRVISPLMFGFADKTFKFVSWLIIIAAIGVAQRATGSQELLWLSRFLGFVYVTALGLIALEVALRGFPESKYVPAGFRWTIAVLLFLFGNVLFALISIPWGSGPMLIDQVLQQLQNASAP